jgi:hypothetical protein
LTLAITQRRVSTSVFTEVTMRTPEVDDFVRLMRDLPELRLPRGEIGVVRSQWCAPEVAYEVEFHTPASAEPTRALLMPDQIEVEEGPLFDHSTVEQSLTA